MCGNVITGGQSADVQKFRKQVLFQMNCLIVSRLAGIIKTCCILLRLVK